MHFTRKIRISVLRDSLGRLAILKCPMIATAAGIQATDCPTGTLRNPSLASPTSRGILQKRASSSEGWLSASDGCTGRSCGTFPERSFPVH